LRLGTAETESILRRFTLRGGVQHPTYRALMEPSEEELSRFYEAVWKAHRVQDMVLIKTFLYTGVRVSELIAIRLENVDLDRCQIRINQGKGSKDRVVPFPVSFREVLVFQIERMQEQRAS